jgi:hypothetical protein
MKDALGHIHCECEHADHFDEYVATVPEDATAIFDTVEHHYGARVTHVLRGGCGIYQCHACERAGHSPSSR